MPQGVPGCLACVIFSLALAALLNAEAQLDPFSPVKLAEDGSRIDADDLTKHNVEGSGSRGLLATTCEDTAANCVSFPQSNATCGPVVNATCLAKLCATRPAWAAGCNKTCSHCPAGSCTDSASNCVTFPKNALNCGPIVNASCLANLCVTRLAWSAGCDSTCKKCPGTSAPTPAPKLFKPAPKPSPKPASVASPARKPAPKPSPSPSPKPHAILATKPSPPKPVSKPSPKPSPKISAKPSPPAAKPSPKPSPKISAKPSPPAAKPSPKPSPKISAKPSPPAAKPSPKRQSPLPSPTPPPPVSPFPSGFYLIAASTSMVRCSRSASTFTCSLNGSFSGTISPSNVLTMSSFTATWVAATASIKWSFGAVWAYKGSRLSPPPGQGGIQGAGYTYEDRLGINGNGYGSLAFGGATPSCILTRYDPCPRLFNCPSGSQPYPTLLDKACETKYDPCRPRITEEIDQCPSHSNRGGINYFLGLVAPGAGNYLLQTFLSSIGLGPSSTRSSVYDIALQHGLSCETGISNAVAVLLFNASSITASGGACSSLDIRDRVEWDPVPYDLNFFAFRTASLGLPACIAINTCYYTLNLGVPGLTATVFSSAQPYALITSSLESVALDFLGKVAILNQANGYLIDAGYWSPFGWGPDGPGLNMWTAGTTNLQSLQSDVPVVDARSSPGGAVKAYRADAHFTSKGPSSAAVNFNVSNVVGVAIANKIDIIYLLQVFAVQEFIIQAGGALISFGSGLSQKIDFSDAPVSIIMYWHYSFQPWATGAANTFLFARLLVQIKGTVSVQALVAQAPKAQFALQALLADLSAAVTPAIYINDLEWHILLSLTTDISLKTIPQDALNFAGVTIPANLASGSSLIVHGTHEAASGAVLVAVAADKTKLFAVNFCAVDTDCMDPQHPSCFVFGGVGVCGVLTSCTRTTYDRGGGVPPSCPFAYELDTADGNTCHPVCSEGYQYIGDGTCKESCLTLPADDESCLFEAAIPKGCCCSWATIFTCCYGQCGEDYIDTGCSCVLNRTQPRHAYYAPITSLTCGFGSSADIDGLCYKNCGDHYFGVLNICRQLCPAHMPGSDVYVGGGWGETCTTMESGSPTNTASHTCPFT